MSVGGVGAAGGASAGGGASTGGAGQSAGVGGASSGGPSSAEGVSPSSGDKASTKDVSDAGDKAGPSYNISQVQNNSVYSNMSTEDSVHLHNCVCGPEKPADMGNIDIKKLIEMMMAMKLLEAMSNSQDDCSSGGFSAIA